MLIGEDYPKISINIGELTLQEPMAIVTNFIMAGVAFYCAWRINKWEAVRFVSLWKWFFISYCLAGFTSAFSHGFFLYLGWPSKIPAWGFGIISIAFIEFAMITLVEKEQNRKVYQFISLFKAAMVMTLAFSNWNFIPVAINSVVSLLLIIAPSAFLISRKGVAGMKWIVSGILFLIPAAILYLGKVNPHVWLNKDDLSHLLMAGSLFFFLNGALVYQSQVLAQTMKRV